MGLMAMPWVVLERPPKTKLGLPKKTVPPLAVAVPVIPDPKKYVKEVLLVREIENTPFRLILAGVPFEELVRAGTPEIRTVVGIPGTKPVSWVEVVAVTEPALYTSEVMAMEEDG